MIAPPCNLESRYTLYSGELRGNIHKLTLYCLRSRPGDPDVVRVCVSQSVRPNIENEDDRMIGVTK